MKHRTLFLIVFALLQTCIAFAGTPFTKEEFQEMVRLFNQHQEANIKKPFDKWTTLPLINKPEGLEVGRSGIRRRSYGWFLLHRQGRQYHFSYHHIYLSHEIRVLFHVYRGRKNRFESEVGRGMFFLLDVFCFSGQSRVLCLRKRMLRRDRGGFRQHKAKTGPGNGEAHPIKQFWLEHDPIEGWHKSCSEEK